MVRVFHFAAFVLLVCLAAPVDPPPGYFPPQFEHVGMGAQISGDFLQSSFASRWLPRSSQPWAASRWHTSPGGSGFTANGIGGRFGSLVRPAALPCRVSSPNPVDVVRSSRSC